MIETLTAQNPSEFTRRHIHVTILNAYIASHNILLEITHFN